MEKETSRIPKRIIDLASTEERKLLEMAEPLIWNDATNLAMWMYSIRHLVEKDLDHASYFTQTIYSNLCDISLERLSLAIKNFPVNLEIIRGKKYASEYERITNILSEAEKNEDASTSIKYPEYVEIAAKWWIKKNTEKFTKHEKEEFLIRMERRMFEQIKKSKVSLIAVTKFSEGVGEGISLRLGGYEERCKFKTYIAMMVSENDISVQEGRSSNWVTIWEKQKS